MRVSHNWLRELLPGLALSTREISASLTSLGLEVEGITEHGSSLSAVRVARVVAVDPHPNKGKLQLVTVDTGGGQSERVVCGASNVPSAGGLVVLAPLGTHLPAVGLTLSARDIGGVVSEGMLCSETELGLADKSDGIIVLPEGALPPGTLFLEAFPEARDTIFELSITPNRPDALGHVGVARDLAAALKLTLVLPSYSKSRIEPTLDAKALVQIENREPSRCPRYGAAVVSGVSVGPSPAWMRWRLHRLGVRPISNVVDITNWLMFEFGQPMHAFDLELFQGRRVIIRCATQSELFTTLDGQARTLSEDDLMICDANRPVALAGVMGGVNTEINAQSREVLLECAYFTPAAIRRSARRHALHSESSHRFERGVNHGGIPAVLERAKTLLCEIAGAQAVSDDLIAQGIDLPVPMITLRATQLHRLLGLTLPFREATDVLTRLGFRIARITDSPNVEALVEGCSFRPDVTLEADLIEEVARVIGYDKIPTQLPRIAPGLMRTSGQLEHNARVAAAALGLSEAISLAFISPGDLQKLGLPPAPVVLTNPLSEERSVMRTSLLPGLFEALRRARRRGEHHMCLFEVGSVFLEPSQAKRSAEATQARPLNPEDHSVVPEQRPMFVAVLAGDRPAHLHKPEALDLYDAKAIALHMIERLIGTIPAVEQLAEADIRSQYLHPRGRAQLIVNGRELGVFGPLHPNTVDAFDLGGPALLIELDLAAVEALGQAVAKYRPIPKLPAVTRDVALEVPNTIPAAEVQTSIAEAGGELCESVVLFDLFEGAPVKSSHRSLAFHVVYRDPKATTDPENARTLTDAEVDERHAQVVRAATERFGASLRA